MSAGRIRQLRVHLDPPEDTQNASGQVTWKRQNLQPMSE